MATEIPQGRRQSGPDWPLIIFFILAFAIAWILAGLIAIIADRSGVPDAGTLMSRGEVFDLDEYASTLVIPEWAIYAITRLIDFAFTIAGIIMIAAVEGSAGLRRLVRRLVDWRFHWRWYLLAAAPIIFYIVAAALTALGDDTIADSLDLGSSTWGTILFSLQAGFIVTLLTRGPLGEEPGLRGFALPRLQRHFSPVKASLVLGLLWGLWHLPAFLGRDLVNIILFMLLVTAITFIFTWLFNGSGGSFIPGLIFHAAQNTEEIYETILPGLVGTDWELISSLALLILGIIAGIRLWRRPPVAITQ